MVPGSCSALYLEQTALCSVSSCRRSISFAAGISLAYVGWELFYAHLCQLLSTTAGEVPVKL